MPERNLFGNRFRNEVIVKTYLKHKTIGLILLFACILTIGLFTGCEKPKTEQKTFIVGFDAEFPPYGYKDADGEYVGFDLSLAEEVCKRNNWKLVKQPIDWDSKDLELETGAIDCIWNGFTMTGNEEKYTWSSAYIDNSQVVIVKKNSSISKLTDLKGKIVIVQSASSALAAFQGKTATKENKALAKTFAKLQQVSNYNSAFMNLESGIADAICMDQGVAHYELASKKGDFTILSDHISKEQYGIGFKLGNTSLRDKVETTLQEMLKDGTFKKIATDWDLTDCICLGDKGSDKVMKTEQSTTSNKYTIKHVTSIVKQLAKGMKATLLIFILTLLFSMPLGLFICFIRRSHFVILQKLAKIYISIMRGTPLMLQLLVVCFGPYYLFGVSLSYSYRFYAVIIGFSLNYAAYFAEIYRSGIESIPRGQYEAADVLGYSKIQTFWKIIFPQMVKRVMPPVTNEIITLVKDTSLAFALTYTEMFTLAKQIAATETNIIPLVIAGIFYYIFNFLVAWVMEQIEKKMQYYR